MVLRATSGAIFILQGHLSGNKQALQTVLFTAGQQIADEIRPIQQRFLAHTLLAAGFFNLRIFVLTPHTPFSAWSSVTLLFLPGWESGSAFQSVRTDRTSLDPGNRLQPQI